MVKIDEPKPVKRKSMLDLINDEGRLANLMYVEKGLMIDTLVNKKFPNLTLAESHSFHPSASNEKRDNDSQRPDYVDARKYQIDLWSLLPADLWALYQQEYPGDYSPQDDELQEFDGGWFFDQPRAQALMSYWVKAAYWTPDEAVALSFLKAPNVVNEKSLEIHRDKANFAIEYFERKELVDRAIFMEVLSNPIQPQAFVEWAIDKNIHPPGKKSWHRLGFDVRDDRAKQGQDPLKKNKSFQLIEQTARNAIKDYPTWKSQLGRKPRIQDVLDWLRDKHNLQTREAHIIKDILSDNSTEFP